MGREIELKLTIGKADIDNFVHHPLISRYLAGPVIRKRLINHYYDTPEQMLRESHMALRVRWDGDAYIQTLKRKGRSRNGLTDREEWEWPLEGPGLATSLVPMDFWPAALKPHLDEIVPLFETNFERTAWILAFPAGSFSACKTPAKVEMALDQGKIRAAAGRFDSGDEILEVELELMAGDSKILNSVYGRLAETIPLEPNDMSKAERGYRLING